MCGVGGGGGSGGGVGGEGGLKVQLLEVDCWRVQEDEGCVWIGGLGGWEGRGDSRCNIWKLIAGEFKRTRGVVCRGGVGGEWEGSGDSKCNVWKLIVGEFKRTRGGGWRGGVGGEGGLKGATFGS